MLVLGGGGRRCFWDGGSALLRDGARMGTPDVGTTRDLVPRDLSLDASEEAQDQSLVSGPRGCSIRGRGTTGSGTSSGLTVRFMRDFMHDLTIVVKCGDVESSRANRMKCCTRVLH